MRGFLELLWIMGASVAVGLSLGLAVVGMLVVSGIKPLPAVGIAPWMVLVVLIGVLARVALGIGGKK